MRRLLFLAVLVALGCVAPAVAGGITLSTGQSDYTVQVGEDVKIPIAVENTLGADTTGVLTQGVRFVPEGGEGSSPAARTQSRSITLFQDTREIAAGAGTAAEPGTFFFEVAFEYGDVPRTRVALPEIRVHVVSSATEQAEQPEQQVNSVSSVSTSSGSGGSSSPSSGKLPGQMAQDLGSLQEQAAQERDRMQALRSALFANLDDDPLVLEIHTILTSHGYVRATTTIDPTDEGTGTFSFGYRSGSGEILHAGGLVVNGSAAYAAYATDRSLVVPDILTVNETYCRFEGELADAGFFPVSAAVNATPGTIFVSVGFADGQNRTARIIATLAGGEVRSVDLDEPPGLFLLAGVGTLCIILLIAYLIRNRAPGAPEPEEPSVPLPPRDPRDDVLRLLDEARSQFDRGDRKEAYGTAGRALRLYLSSAYGSGTELADGDVLHLLRERGHETRAAASILEQCAAVSYAQSPPEENGFLTVIRAIEAFIGEINEVSLT